MAKNPQLQAEKIYQQILDLLEELAAVYVQAGAEEDEDRDGPSETEVIETLVEEAAERGLNEQQVDRILKMISTCAHTAAED